MPRHVLLVERPGAVPPVAVPPGWHVTCAEEAELALFWLRHTPPDLILVGARTAEMSPTRFVRAVRADHAASLLPLVQVGDGFGDEVCAEPDAWLPPWSSPDTAVAAAFAQALAARAERLRDGVRAAMHLSVPSDLGRLEEVANLVGPWLIACGFAPQASQQLTLAVRELTANAIEWGHRLDRSRRVSLHARLDQEKATVSVRDSGPGFDVSDVPHAARPGDPLSHLAVRSTLAIREGGFGILMARGMADHLCYNETGNEAQIIKYLPRKAKEQRRASAGR